MASSRRLPRPAPAMSARSGEAFAKYGVGVGAQATVKGSKITIVESFAVPAGCPAP